MYAVHAALVGPEDGWRAIIAHAAALGCDAVLVPPLAAPDDDNDVLAMVAAIAREHGLFLVLDLDLSRAAAGSALAATLPHAFATAAGSDGRDPRLPPDERGIRRALWHDGAAAAALADWWQGALERWSAIGVAGFRCLAPASIPAPVWRRLMAATPACGFLAWAPGTARAALPALRGAGFSACFDSLAWWNLRDGWFAEEHAALAPIGAVIATLEAPGEERLAAGFPPDEVARGVDRVAAVASLADGALVPMGMEFGARRRFDHADTPADWQSLLADPPADLRAVVRTLNATLAAAQPDPTPLTPLTGPDAPVLAFARRRAGRIAIVNPSTTAPATLVADAVLAGLDGRFGGFAATDAAELRLSPGGAALLQAVPASPVRAPRPAVGEAAALPRVAIEAVTPTIDDGRFAVKRIAGETVAVTCDLICDGHDRLAGALRWRAADADVWQEARLRPLGNDGWGASIPLARPGRHVFVVEGWVDLFATWRHGLEAKLAAGQTVELEIEEGRMLLAGVDAAFGRKLAEAGPDARLALLRDPATAALMEARDPRAHRTTSREYAIDADRTAARFASWYELFPRSQSGDPARHGNFDDVIRQLPRIRAMGFDVLYFPPIHPIGSAFRKGRNNTLTPGPEDPGSPYAIGSEAGGHDAIHAELGTLDDFKRLRDAAAVQGLELALDFAVQCSPDHPWLREHRGWFAWRPDGSLRYAENPPKKYQDIVNVDFHAPDAVPSLWLALRDIVRFWADAGVRLFRVDNPHTKPLPFWEWLIADIRATDPDVVFLAEAFTRPKVMYRLAKLGFGQSYTYFTWRNEKREIMDYLTELTTTAPRDFFRPHFFVNTPDINPVFLQGGGRPAHLIRAALACTLSGLWGMYQGFEFCEATPLPGREEYQDSEKYQIRAWPDRSPGDIVDEIARLNAIRRGNPALHDHLGVAFHEADNDRVIWYRKRDAHGTNVLLVAVSLNPHAAEEAAVALPLWEWGLKDDASLEAEELMTGARFTWRGKMQRVRLEPTMPFAIWRVRPEGPFRVHLPPVAAAPAPTGHG